MGHPLTYGTYNLLEEKWIPVLYIDGETKRVGILQILKEARNIRQIAASNPMDRVALLRFLLAVLMWCKEDVKSSLAALDEQNADIPENWLDKLKINKAAFNLLGDGKRFYQDESVKGKESRPIGDVLVEFPGADSVNHMRHVVHGRYGFCPACCAMGILRLSVWAPANRYYPASVNPNSAAYAFIEGRNLFQTFYANLPETNPHANQAPWLVNEQPDSPDAIALLAWRPRKLWLNVEDSSDQCAYCAQTGTLAKSLCIEKGWSTPVTTGQKFGKDVLLEFQKLNGDYKMKNTNKRKLADKVAKISPVILMCRMPALLQADSKRDQAPENESTEAKIARIFDQLYAADNQETIQELTKKPSKQEEPLLDQQDIQAKKFWVEDPHLLIKKDEAMSLPNLSEDVGLHASKFWRDALLLHRAKTLARGIVGDGQKALAIGIVGDGRYVFHDSYAVRLPNAAAITLAKLTSNCANALSGTGNQEEKSPKNSETKLKRRGILRTVTYNPNRQHPEIAASVKLLTPNTEVQIRDRLSRINALTGDNAIEDKAFLHELYGPVVELVIASITPGSPLRRRAARNHAQALLKEKIKELVEKPNHPPNIDALAAAPDIQKHSLKKEDPK